MEFVNIPEDEFLKEVNELLEFAQRENVTIKALGALGIYLSVQHLPEVLVKYKSLDRLGEGNPMFTDLDVMAISKESKQVVEFFQKKLNYKPDQYVNTLFGHNRNIFYHPKGYFHVDVFYDALRYSHEVYFTNGRLDPSLKTIYPEDFALEKLQIHQINRKDLVDLFILFLTHKISSARQENCIDSTHVARILADDWGFWYDATQNLEKEKNLVDSLLEKGRIDKQDYEIVTKRISELLKVIDETEKTRAWQKRAKKGTSKVWYNEVDEVER